MIDQVSLDAINAFSKNTLMETLDIRITEVSDDKVVATMPVNAKVHQPDGVLHGGATAALAETLGSFASIFSINRETHMVRGIEITANHLKSVSSGIITATATPIHRGRTTQLWNIQIIDEENRLISVCKLTTIVLPKK